ncbi:hypothetical protein Daura_16885 [Dactylosporangium aurantiacum]|uniref:Arylsulfatase n=1 Tax=Dactylosporangium aurantiacum TaxID=35754 RepID=A0A9Q9MP92_9ACTN|nr:hypothetical protein [Dactylosporangium aurantiacum]MDG6103181.1 hypothetical protein [Dactylosporangium aurantiacum]UWZ60266.1 hypothetical protein Daura_16885 [Dactylosporangium aurantiacum]
MPIIGFLHTAEVHVATFRDLLADLAPGAADVHAVDETLLADARAHGVGADVRARLAAHVQALADAGARVVVCTCSTLSGHAETLAAAVPVLRVDRPMAQAAVAAAAAGGGRVAVVAALASTLAPTTALLRECAGDAAVELVEAPCLDAWPLFESGDIDGYVRRIAGHVRAVAAPVSSAPVSSAPAPSAPASSAPASSAPASSAPASSAPASSAPASSAPASSAPGGSAVGFDVVVLAQASMAPAVDLLRDLPVPVLSSPRAAVARAVAVAGSPGTGVYG